MKPCVPLYMYSKKTLDAYCFEFEPTTDLLNSCFGLSEQSHQFLNIHVIQCFEKCCLTINKYASIQYLPLKKMPNKSLPLRKD